MILNLAHVGRNAERVARPSRTQVGVKNIAQIGVAQAGILLNRWRNVEMVDRSRSTAGRLSRKVGRISSMKNSTFQLTTAREDRVLSNGALFALETLNPLADRRGVKSRPTETRDLLERVKAGQTALSAPLCSMERNQNGVV